MSVEGTRSDQSPPAAATTGTPAPAPRVAVKPPDPQPQTPGPVQTPPSVAADGVQATAAAKAVQDPVDRGVAFQNRRITVAPDVLDQLKASRAQPPSDAELAKIATRIDALKQRLGSLDALLDKSNGQYQWGDIAAAKAKIQAVRDQLEALKQNPNPCTTDLQQIYNTLFIDVHYNQALTQLAKPAYDIIYDGGEGSLAALNDALPRKVDVKALEQRADASASMDLKRAEIGVSQARWAQGLLNRISDKDCPAAERAQCCQALAVMGDIHVSQDSAGGYLVRKGKSGKAVPLMEFWSQVKLDADRRMVQVSAERIEQAKRDSGEGIGTMWEEVERLKRTNPDSPKLRELEAIAKKTTEEVFSPALELQTQQHCRDVMQALCVLQNKSEVMGPDGKPTGETIPRVPPATAAERAAALQLLKNYDFRITMRPGSDEVETLQYAPPAGTPKLFGMATDPHFSLQEVTNVINKNYVEAQVGEVQKHAAAETAYRQARGEFDAAKAELEALNKRMNANHEAGGQLQQLTQQPGWQQDQAKTEKLQALANHYGVKPANFRRADGKTDWDALARATAEAIARDSAAAMNEVDRVKARKDVAKLKIDAAAKALAEQGHPVDPEELAEVEAESRAFDQRVQQLDKQYLSIGQRLGYSADQMSQLRHEVALGIHHGGPDSLPTRAGPAQSRPSASPVQPAPAAAPGGKATGEAAGSPGSRRGEVEVEIPLPPTDEREPVVTPEAPDRQVPVAEIHEREQALALEAKATRQHEALTHSYEQLAQDAAEERLTRAGVRLEHLADKAHKQATNAPD